MIGAMRAGHWLLVLGLAGCRPSTGAVAVRDSGQGVVDAGVVTPVAAPPERACPTTQEWLARAEAADRIGLSDVANGYRGRVYAQEPDLERLFAWIDGQVRSGELRRARVALMTAHGGGDAAWNYEVRRRLEGLPAPASGGSSAPVSVDELAAARTAVAAGQDEEAVAAGTRAYARETAPERLAEAGRLLWDLGAREAARRAWTRARIQLDELGTTFAVVTPEVGWKARARPSLQVLQRGRFLAVASGSAGGEAVWDLQARWRVASTRSREEHIAGLSLDARHVAVRRSRLLEIRGVDADEPVFRAECTDLCFERIQFVRDGALLVDAKSSNVWFVELPGGAVQRWMVPIQGEHVALSFDGRWLKARDTDGTLQLWRPVPDGEIRILGRSAWSTRFADDGTFLALTRQWRARAGGPDGRARQAAILPMDGGETIAGPVLEGEKAALEVTPDGSGVWIYDDTDRLLLWTIDGGPQAITVHELDEDLERARLVDTGTVLLVVRHESVVIHGRDGALPRLGMILPLANAGWALFGEHGALDGSEDAAEALITQVHWLDRTDALEGRVGWDAQYVEGLLERAWAGEVVAAPVRPSGRSPAEPGCRGLHASACGGVVR